MYIARIQNRGETRYFLRQSYWKGDRYASRDLLEFHPHPAAFIVYPGGKAFYIHETVEEQLALSGIEPDAEALENLFWPYLRPDIKQAVSFFQHRSRSRSKTPRLSDDELERIRASVHPFDKRRRHYLKFGNPDQGPTARMPSILFKDLIDKSRDEIEQSFMRQERQLKSSEVKTYLFASLDLQRHFSSFMAAKMPQTLDQEQVDAVFIEDICRINQAFFHSRRSYQDAGLHDYFIRYVIMFFDHTYANSTLLDEFVQDFIFRHRFYRPVPAQPSVRTDKACQFFDIPEKELERMGKRRLTRRWRRLVRIHHPDKGGSAEEFVKLNRYYQHLLQRIKDTGPVRS